MLFRVAIPSGRPRRVRAVFLSYLILSGCPFGDGSETDRSLRCVQAFPSSARSWRAGVPRVEWIRARLGMLTRGVIRSVVPSQQ